MEYIDSTYYDLSRKDMEIPIEKTYKKYKLPS